MKPLNSHQLHELAQQFILGQVTTDQCLELIQNQEQLDQHIDRHYEMFLDHYRKIITVEKIAMKTGFQNPHAVDLSGNTKFLKYEQFFMDRIAKQFQPEDRRIK